MTPIKKRKSLYQTEMRVTEEKLRLSEYEILDIQ